LDDLGLTPALLWLFERYTGQTGIRVHVESVGLEKRLPPEVETTAYRIVQEALTNVARYAQVPEAWVRLRASGDMLRLQVEDRGRGFDVEAALASGQRAGIAGMKERAVLLGGWLQVEATPGTGTTVAAVLPLKGRLERRRHDRLNSAGG
jgi:signal transduction histidine kinase